MAQIIARTALLGFGGIILVVIFAKLARAYGWAVSEGLFVGAMIGVAAITAGYLSRQVSAKKGVAKDK